MRNHRFFGWTWKKPCRTKGFCYDVQLRIVKEIYGNFWLVLLKAVRKLFCWNVSESSFSHTLSDQWNNECQQRIFMAKFSINLWRLNLLHHSIQHFGSLGVMLWKVMFNVSSVNDSNQSEDGLKHKSSWGRLLSACGHSESEWQAFMKISTSWNFHLFQKIFAEFVSKGCRSSFCHFHLKF